MNCWRACAHSSAAIGRKQATDVLRFADLTLNLRTRQCFRGSTEIQLTAREFDLLELFMRHPNQVLTREVIYEHIWNYDFGGESNIIEVYIRYLRSKLEVGERSASSRQFAAWDMRCAKSGRLTG